MVLLGLGARIGFAPYADYGWAMSQEFAKDYVFPVRITALKKLENDRDPSISKGLVTAASDKHWTVRVAALSAIARHGDVNLIGPIMPYMSDKKPAVRYAAAAAILRLSALVSRENNTSQSSNDITEAQISASAE